MRMGVKNSDVEKWGRGLNRAPLLKGYLLVAPLRYYARAPKMLAPLSKGSFFAPLITGWVEYSKMSTIRTCLASVESHNRSVVKATNSELSTFTDQLLNNFLSFTSDIDTRHLSLIHI